MRINKFLVVFGIMLVGAFGCTGSADRQAGEINKDSLDNLTDSTDLASLANEECYTRFFNHLPGFADSNSAVLVMGDGKRLNMPQFFKDEYMGPVSHYGTKDLDRNGVPELIIYNHTGGAHCCDEYYLFTQTSPTEYLFKAHLMGGSTCIDASSNTFTYSFSETFGYFFSCYACEFNDSTTAFEIMRTINLEYENGRLQIVPYGEADEKQNLANLGVLQQHGYEKIEGQMDNGWRKEFAMNFAVWHYNHGQQWEKTKALFDQYYQFEDAANVWREFYNTLNDSRKENSF